MTTKQEQIAREFMGGLTSKQVNIDEVIALLDRLATSGGTHAGEQVPPGCPSCGNKDALFKMVDGELNCICECFEDAAPAQAPAAHSSMESETSMALAASQDERHEGEPDVYNKPPLPKGRLSTNQPAQPAPAGAPFDGERELMDLVERAISLVDTAPESRGQWYAKWDERAARFLTDAKRAIANINRRDRDAEG